MTLFSRLGLKLKRQYQAIRLFSNFYSFNVVKKHNLKSIIRKEHFFLKTLFMPFKLICRIFCYPFRKSVLKREGKSKIGRIFNGGVFFKNKI